MIRCVRCSWRTELWPAPAAGSPLGLVGIRKDKEGWNKAGSLKLMLGLNILRSEFMALTYSALVWVVLQHQIKVVICGFPMWAVLGSVRFVGAVLVLSRLKGSADVVWGIFLSFNHFCWLQPVFSADISLPWNGIWALNSSTFSLCWFVRVLTLIPPGKTPCLDPSRHIVMFSESIFFKLLRLPVFFPEALVSAMLLICYEHCVNSKMLNCKTKPKQNKKTTKANSKTLLDVAQSMCLVDQPPVRMADSVAENSSLLYLQTSERDAQRSCSFCASKYFL